ncbi:hypothetical protein BGZ46_004212 [Entomortierella lignicola]|nr:hypothetical protein BGZ46_004212 [Entomortierella lignicola]
MALRILRLLPAIAALEEKSGKLLGEEQRQIQRLASKILNPEEISNLRGAMALLEIVYNFTNQVSVDCVPVASYVFLEIYDLIGKMEAMPIANPGIDGFKKNLQKMKNRWNLENIPDCVLIVTFLNPAVSKHSFLFGETQRDENSVVLREHARGLIFGILRSIRSRGPMAPVQHESYESDMHTGQFKEELKQYDDELDESSFDMYKTRPQDWWKGRAMTYPNLSHLARVHFSTQASSASLERLFSVAGGILTPKRASMSDYLFCRILLLKKSEDFLSQLKGQ